MTITNILTTYSKQLKTISSSPILDIELLISKTLNKPKEYLYTYPDKQLTNQQFNKFKILFKRRKKGEPIAYILGYQEFFNLQFKVNTNVLIPRPETELLIDEVIKYTSDIKPPISIFDIGVGSGAIIITLANYIKNGKFYGTDISSKALKIAKQNAKKHKIKINFLKGNLIIPFKKILKQTSNTIITANLPYLDKGEKNLLTSTDTKGLKFEPKIAWDGGKDGLKYYKDFFQQIQDYQIKPSAIFLEIGHTQTKPIKKIIPLILNKHKITVKKDLNGFDRLIIISSK